MCQGCWEEYGSPTDDSPEIRRAAYLIDLIYETEVTGAPLHVELDDWNIDDDCWVPYPPARDEGWLEDPSKWDVAVELCELMKAMSLRERASAMARGHGYLR